MKTALIQNMVVPQPAGNIHTIQSLCSGFGQERPELILLPELWNTPYTNEMIRKNAQSGPLCLEAMQQLARTCQAWLIGGTIPWKENGNIYNRCFVLDPDGNTVCCYDKTHLMELHTARSDYSEADVFTRGDHLSWFEAPWGKTGINVCYDIRFSEMARTLSREGIRILAVPAAFNHSVGEMHWEILMRTRALENEIYVLACNPAAYSYEGYHGYGHSMVVAPDGRILCQAGEGQEVLLADLDLQRIDAIRSRMPFWKIRRGDLYD